VWKNIRQNQTMATCGFSSFASLRPQWCILAGASGTHSVCVCTYHQNSKLMVSALNIADKSITWHVMMEKCVYDTTNKQCMMHKCDTCPGIEGVIKYVNEVCPLLQDQQEIEYNKWVSVDKSSLLTLKESTDEFIETLANSFYTLTSHHYTSKSQMTFYKDLKMQLEGGEILVLLDFAENYSFIVQDAAQSFHWDNTQATLHPVVVYHKNAENQELKCTSFCIISDSMTHSTSAVHIFLKKVYTNFDFGPLTHVHYFSDGAASQYKNKFNFINILHHESDFGVPCSWHFFATSHGKSPCDGIGGTVKRLTARASLQRPVKNQILNAQQMFDFAKDNIKGIKFVWVSAEEVVHSETSLEKRFQQAAAIPGTRSLHSFTASKASQGMLQVKILSSDVEFTLVLVDQSQCPKKFRNLSTLSHNIHIGCYVSFKYAEQLYAGQITDIVDDNNIMINAMTRAGPLYWRWPSDKDEIYYDIENIIKILPNPTVTTSRGDFSFETDLC